jgi:hypothetical protein
MPAAAALFLGNTFVFLGDGQPTVADVLRRCGERPACRRAR